MCICLPHFATIVIVIGMCCKCNEILSYKVQQLECLNIFLSLIGIN